LERLSALQLRQDGRLLRSLLESTWVLSENWLQTVSNPEAPVRALTVFQSYRMILDILQPYLCADRTSITDESWDAISAHVSSSETPAG
jgi:hypothetical protein